MTIQPNVERSIIIIVDLCTASIWIITFDFMIIKYNCYVFAPVCIYTRISTPKLFPISKIFHKLRVVFIKVPAFICNLRYAACRIKLKHHIDFRARLSIVQISHLYKLGFTRIAKHDARLVLIPGHGNIFILKLSIQIVNQLFLFRRNRNKRFCAIHTVNCNSLITIPEDTGHTFQLGLSSRRKINAVVNHRTRIIIEAHSHSTLFIFIQGNIFCIERNGTILRINCILSLFEAGHYLRFGIALIAPSACKIAMLNHITVRMLINVKRFSCMRNILSFPTC